MVQAAPVLTDLDSVPGVGMPHPYVNTRDVPAIQYLIAGNQLQDSGPRVQEYILSMYRTVT